ncbi:dipeptidase [Sphingopyxis alaskensis]|uniref:Peptidase M19, renal dipeptidase n=1 Tax=Sphingopyxis alaskensis (strain DSM 13593 / LMG 18877 / RB2256) TaxID=317655 RepID=Q1GT50_SPHAL|nr:dipeptidase [Sphingopyxis alaskensis]ABF53172.1 peptidase M19, renal dipeptidase [Sphingopyxis alaskensis RB2256]MCM3418591.1 dipeptidase [Sphingopyxis alaskensis]
MKQLAILLTATALAACSTGGDKPKAAEAPLHSRMLVLDTHLDTPLHFERAGWSFADRHTLADDMVQLDIPRMKDGHLDGGFFVIYTEQGPLTAKGYADALAFARGRSDLIDSTLAKYPDAIAPARTAADARRLNREGKLIAFKSMENSYPLGEDLTLLAEFYARGLRMAGPVHSRTNQFADSATGEARWKGLSPLGKRWVAEMNRLGIVIDASHSSDAAFDQMLELSKYPIILSHSSLRSAHDHPRNLDEARLKALAAKGGAMCISTIFLSDMNMTPARAGLFGQYERIGAMTPAEQADLNRKWRELDQSEPLWAADFEDYMKMVLRAIAVAGADHICFGADWDGGGGLKGIEDITALPKVTARLKEAGYSDADIEKMWSGNVLRILAAQGK